MRVLIADDDPIALELLRDALTDAGHDVACARDGREALELLARSPRQILITDWEMPELDGINLCHAVRRASAGQLGGGGYVYIILLTSHGSTAERVRGLSAGADDFMTKPFEPLELLARLQGAERLLSLETRDVAIFALARLAESRDVETGAHLERVMHYSRILAQQLPAIGRYVDEIDPEFVRLIYSTSPLHDIGKVGIPDGVLLKPGRLDDREFEVMKTHASIGAATLDAALRQFPTAKFLRMARDIAATHHERWDGQGYPAGLTGQDIPLCGRIVALADVYDALTSKRVYKNAFAHDVAKGIIVKEAGTHFDPAVVEAFLGAEPAFIEVRERYQASQSAAAA
jgi:putative two-component system response regulator